MDVKERYEPQIIYSTRDRIEGEITYTKVGTGGTVWSRETRAPGYGYRSLACVAYDESGEVLPNSALSFW